MMEEQDFKKKADEALRSLQRSLAVASEDHPFDTDLGDALTIEFDEPYSKFVVSPNAPVRQIWVSAHSRSFKLGYEEDRGQFVLADTGQTLTALLEDAISRQLGEAIELR